MAQSRQKSYADRWRSELEFQVEDLVLLKVSPRKGVIRFRKRRNLGPTFISPFRVLASGEGGVMVRASWRVEPDTQQLPWFLVEEVYSRWDNCGYIGGHLGWWSPELHWQASGDSRSKSENLEEQGSEIG